MPVDKSPLPKPYLVDSPKATPSSPATPADPELARWLAMPLDEWAKAAGEAIAANLRRKTGNKPTP